MMLIWFIKILYLILIQLHSDLKRDNGTQPRGSDQGEVLEQDWNRRQKVNTHWTNRSLRYWFILIQFDSVWRAVAIRCRLSSNQQTSFYHKNWYISADHWFQNNWHPHKTAQRNLFKDDHLVACIWNLPKGVPIILICFFERERETLNSLYGNDFIRGTEKSLYSKSLCEIQGFCNHFNSMNKTIRKNHVQKRRNEKERNKCMKEKGEKEMKVFRKWGKK